jgi:phosphoglycolate phosphatase
LLLAWAAVRFPLVLFDLDGTLVDSLPDIGWALNTALAEIGRPPLSLPVVRTLIGEGVMRLAAKALAMAPGAPPPAEAVQALGERTRAIYREHPCRETKVFPGVRSVIGALREAPGRRLGVLTNKPGEVTRPLLAALKLTDAFDVILGDGEGYPPKPDPTGARALAARFGMGPAQMLIVGDGVPDLQLAAALGAHAAAVTWGYNDRSVLAALAPAYVIDAPAELTAIC